MSTAIEEPPELERVWYRHKDTGDLGYLVKQGGRPKIRLNRPNEVILKAFDEGIWYLDDRRHELLPMQRCKVAFEADKELCRTLGLVELARRDWTRLKDSERIAWLENGPRPVNDPSRDRVRFALWKAIMAVMERLS